MLDASSFVQKELLQHTALESASSQARSSSRLFAQPARANLLLLRAREIRQELESINRQNPDNHVVLLNALGTFDEALQDRNISTAFYQLVDNKTRLIDDFANACNAAFEEFMVAFQRDPADNVTARQRISQLLAADTRASEALEQSFRFDATFNQSLPRAMRDQIIMLTGSPPVPQVYMDGNITSSNMTRACQALVYAINQSEVGLEDLAVAETALNATVFGRGQLRIMMPSSHMRDVTYEEYTRQLDMTYIFFLTARRMWDQILTAVRPVVLDMQCSELLAESGVAPLPGLAPLVAAISLAAAFWARDASLY
jgi:hypothetical protein